MIGNTFKISWVSARILKINQILDRQLTIDCSEKLKVRQGIEMRNICR
jgi:hypothetical protein